MGRKCKQVLNAGVPGANASGSGIQRAINQFDQRELCLPDN
jgi:hypothetical protein